VCDRPDRATAEQLPSLVRSAQLAVDAALAAAAPSDEPDVHLATAGYLLQQAVSLLDDPATAGAPSGSDHPGDLVTAIAEIHGLRRAMLNRSVIEQAKGMLMLRLGVDEEQAFVALSRLSQRTHVKVAEVSQLLITKGIAEHGQWRRRRSLADGP
jgi:hypothetical protein